MVRRRRRDRSLFEILLPDGHKLWPDWLRRIDTLLEDDAVLDVVAQALEMRWPQSRRRGRPGTPAEVVVRMLILKHLFDWSYDDLEQEVRANLVYRAFTRLAADEVPDAETILKIARALGPDVIEQLHRQVVDVAKRAGVTRGRRFRIDTTVVETNVHYPTDSTLLQVGVGVLTRTMQRASTALGEQPGRIRNRLRNVMRGVLTIAYQARSPKTRDAMVQSYRKLMATTRAVVRDADTMIRRLSQRRRTASAATASVLHRAHQHLRQMRPLVERVVAQTRAQIMGGDTHVPDKVLSIFQPHTTTIRKGKIEHIFPQSPTDTWSGDGLRDWTSFTEEERARQRALLQTLGNLALLEQPLNAGASNRPFAEKKTYYLRSKVGSTKALADAVKSSDGETPSIWNVRALEARTEELTEKFLQIWHRPGSDIEDPGDDPMPILDAPKKPGWYPGWRTEFEYVRFRGDTWEVHDVKTLYNRVFKRLWSTHRPAVLAYSTSRKGPIFETKEWESQWDALPDSHYLFTGYFPQYMLGHVQGVLNELGLADEVFVKHSSDENDGSSTAAEVGDT